VKVPAYASLFFRYWSVTDMALLVVSTRP